MPAEPHPDRPQTAEAEVVVIDPGNQEVDMGSLDPAERTELKAEIDGLQLAHTGYFHKRMAAGGLFLIVFGTGLVVVSGRRRRATS